MAIELGIVVPCFDEEAVLPETARRLAALLSRLISAGSVAESSRIWFVDDGSRDRTWDLIGQFARDGLPVCGVRLSRNRGHQNALLAGLFVAEGDALVSIDADLQDDVDAIERMLVEYQQGSDIVYGVRSDRSCDTPFKRTSARWFYRLMSMIGAESIENHADFRLMSRRAVEELRQYREVNLYLRGIIPLIGFRYTVVEYDRASRFAGESKYPLRKMLALSLNAVTSFSVTPLRLVSLLGLVVFVGSMAVSAWVLAVVLFTDRAIAGWASTVLPICVLGGLQILSVGIVGEYIGKIYLEAKGRPKYSIDTVVRAEANRWIDR
jgi:glycosyltransferase involved in cell wall biosynthesis